MGNLTLITGGARSGKSDYAERLAAERGGRVLFVATAQAWDDEMRARITAHKASRPSAWQTLEAAHNVAATLAARAGAAPECVLLDCMTLLVSNVVLMLGDALDGETAQAAVDAELVPLLAQIEAGSADWIVVTNEVGLGIVPENRLARLYRDVLGRANQRLAAQADHVVLLVAGLPLTVK